MSKPIEINKPLNYNDDKYGITPKTKEMILSCYNIKLDNSKIRSDNNKINYNIDYSKLSPFTKSIISTYCDITFNN